MANEYAAGQRDSRPWGDWEVLDTGPNYVVKRLSIAPGGRLSLQKHDHRAEHWVVAAGTPRATIGSAVIDLSPGHAVDIALGEVHRIENPSAQIAIVIELQRGEELRESDIIRIEDIYSRAGAG